MSDSIPSRDLVVEADGGSRGNPGPAGYGALVRRGESVLAERAEFIGTATNNVAEYRGLIAGLRAAAQIDPAARVSVRMDSKLVVEQMTGRWKIKHPDMRELALEAREILPSARVDFEWIPRARNGAADALANEAMDGGAGTLIERDFYASDSAQAPAEPSSPEALFELEPRESNLTWVALLTPDANPGAISSWFSVGQWQHIPALNREDSTTPSVASTIGEFQRALKHAITSDRGGTSVITAPLEVIIRTISSALELAPSTEQLLDLQNGSCTVIGYESDGQVGKILAIGAPV